MKSVTLRSALAVACALTTLSSCGAPPPVELPYSQDFCCERPADWAYNSSNEGRITIRNGRLLLDDGVRHSKFSLNEATLCVNLENYEEIVLRFNHTSLNDEFHGLPETFSGSANGDGLALSVNGINWFKVAEFESGDNTVNLSQFMDEKGITPNANTRLKFMQYDNFPANTDGRSFDNVEITGTPVVSASTAVPVPVPYQQSFASKPDAANGWIYDSTNEGRIEVVDRALRLDDRKGNRVYSQNRAVLHVDLRSALNPVLRFKARENSDETDLLPETFTTAAEGDGVAISADGVDWVRVVSLSHLNREWRDYAVNLQDTGIAFGDNVRIAFMQYDNYGHPSDGWEFDDIQIVEEFMPEQQPEVPPTIIPAGADLAEAPIGYWSIGSADYGLEIINRLSRDTFWKVQGPASIQFNTESGFETRVGFPTTRDARWDLRSTEVLRFELFSRDDHEIAGPELSLVSGESRFVYTPQAGAVTMVSANEQWVTVEIPLAGSAEWKRTTIGNPSLENINALELMADTRELTFDFWIDDVRFDPPVETVLPGLTSPDLTVGWIERTPKYERYFLDYPGGRPVVTNPDSKRWPDLNENVTWTAHIPNRGQVRSSSFTVNWWVDDVMVQSSCHEALDPGASTIVNLGRLWEGSQEIRAEIVPDFPGDRTERNNSLSIDSKAMTFGFIVQESTFNELNNTPNRLGSTSCEDYLNTVLDDMARRFALSTYDFAPNGAEMRIRLDKITLEPDNDSLPSAPNDPEVDGGWRFPARSRGEYRNFNILYNNALVHELAHQLGVIDTYRFDVARDRNQVDGRDYRAPYSSLMGGAREEPFLPNTLGPLSVHGINSSLGFRRGHYGEYLYDLPQTIRIQVFDADGIALSGASVNFYQRANSDTVDNIPEFTLTTNPSGVAILPNRPIPGGNVVTATGHTLRPNPFGLLSVVGTDGVFLMEINHEGRTTVKPLVIAEAIVAYARGTVGTYTKQVFTDF